MDFGYSLYKVLTMKITKSQLKRIINEEIEKLVEQPTGGRGSVDVAGSTYTIKKGDNLTKISRKTGVPIKTLVKVNNIKNPDLIYYGGELKSLKIPKTKEKVKEPEEKETRTLGRAGMASSEYLKKQRERFEAVKKALGPRYQRMVKKFGREEADRRVYKLRDELGDQEIQKLRGKNKSGLRTLAGGPKR